MPYHSSKWSFASFWVLLGLQTAVLPPDAGAAGLDGAPRAFLRKHCFDCHDADVTKGGVNLADLDFRPTDPANFELWQKVFEQVRDEQMPPAKKPQPSETDRAHFLTGLEQPLLHADQAEIRDHGRVRSRRLTRREYEYTLHDLLGIDLPLRELLPEDGGAHGFETVADGQQLSHHQLARYLDVADLALTSAFDRAVKGDSKWNRSFTPADLAKRFGGNYRGPDLRDGKSISWPITLQFFGRMYVTQVPEDGWYRITLRNVEAINPGKDGAVWGTLRSGACSSDAPMLFMIGLVEATPTPRDLVFEAWIQKGHRLELKPNDFELRKAPTGATGGNVSFQGRDLASQGFSGIANTGIDMERIYPNASREEVREHLFGKETAATVAEDPKGAVTRLVSRFATRAFHMPMTGEQLQPYIDLALASLGDGDSALDALKAGYRAVLCSPRFLTFIESPGKLDDHALASRLSHALWLSLPDEPLLKLAREGRLHEPAVFASQFDRMLKDSKSQRFIESFTDQWLKLKEIDFTSPDRRQFATFDPVVQESMVMETRAYFRELLRTDHGVEGLVDSDFAFLNGRLMRHYSTEARPAAGEGLQKISLEGSRDRIRGGFVTQGAVLKVTADGTTTSPVVRGVFVNERILGERVPPPPPGVPAIEPDIRGAVSIRDQLEKHRSNASCFACHRSIDPPGLVLENFNPVGQWRTRYGNGRGAQVDGSGETPDGARYDGIVEWKRLYASRPEGLASGFARHFLTYATGAPLRFSDQEDLESILKASAQTHHGLRSLMLHCLQSPIFQKK